MNRHKHFRILALAGSGLSLVVGLAWIFPLYWALNTAFMVDNQTVQQPPSWIPIPPILDQFKYVLVNTSIVRWYFNSIFTAVVVVLAVLLFSMMCAYAISQIHFRGRRTLFIIIMAGFMVPFTTNAVPLFMLLNRLNMVNSYWGIILPQLVSPISVVIYKQFFDQMPLELSDAARIDGAGEFRILFRIFLPLNLNITWALGIVVFIWTWNNFFWPFIIIASNEMMTIPVGITQVQSWFGIAYARQMASAVLAAIPMVIVYIIFQKRVTQGFAVTAGLK